MLASEPAGLSATPERGTNLISETSVPVQMRDVVSGSQRQAWTYTTMRYTDGREVPGFVVGAPLAVRGVGPYELYQLFPLDTEQETLSLVRNATAVAGLFIILGLAGLATLVTFMIVSPVHEAARTARRFSSGHLEARMRVRGQDDLAQLAESFNEMAGTLQSQIDELEKLSSVQQQFVADVSHELRTPLTTVRMAADLLHDKRQELPPDDARAVELLQNQLNRFEALLADLLETSRQDAGSVQLDYEEVDLRAMCERVAAALEPLAQELRQPGGRDRARQPGGALRRAAGRADPGQPDLERPRARDGPAGGRRGDAGGRRGAAGRHGPGRGPDPAGGHPGVHPVLAGRSLAGAPRRRHGLGLSIALGDARAHGGTLSASGAPGDRARPSRCGCRWLPRGWWSDDGAAPGPGSRRWPRPPAWGWPRVPPSRPRGPSSRGRSSTRGSPRSSSG